MEIILVISTILGGLTALWFLWDKFSENHSSQVSDDLSKVKKDSKRKVVGLHTMPKKTIWVSKKGLEFDVSSQELIIIGWLHKFKEADFEKLVLFGELSYSGTRKILDGLMEKGIVELEKREEREIYVVSS